jgi:GrpB-like predicted nucleotidyltransferase (UPF0157 family)
MKVAVVEYNKEWPKLFDQERNLLLTELGKTAVCIEHIGSTSVPGLAARPVIDIMAGLRDFAEADSLVPKVTDLGYTYIREYEDVIPNRRFFRKTQNGKDTHHIHMVEIGSEFWERHLLFRDYLKENPETATEYALLKKKLARHQWKDTNDYAEAKTQFIKGIEEQARERKKPR